MLQAAVRAHARIDTIQRAALKSTDTEIGELRERQLRMGRAAALAQHSIADGHRLNSSLDAEAQRLRALILRHPLSSGTLKDTALATLSRSAKGTPRRSLR